MFHLLLSRCILCTSKAELLSKKDISTHNHVNRLMLQGVNQLCCGSHSYSIDNHIALYIQTAVRNQSEMGNSSRTAR